MWLDQEREGSGDAEKLGRPAGGWGGCSPPQEAPPCSRPVLSRPQVTRFPISRPQGSTALPVTQPPVHSQRRPSPPRLLRWRSSSTAQNPSARSFGPASGFLGSKAGEEEPLDTRSKRACRFTPARSGRPHGGACRPLAAAVCPGGVGGADGRGVGRKRRKRKRRLKGCRAEEAQTEAQTEGVSGGRGTDGSADGRGFRRKLHGGLGARSGLCGLGHTHMFPAFPPTHLSPILKQQLTGE